MAISHDPVKDLQTLRRELELDYPLLSDASYRLIDRCAGREANRKYARPTVVVVGPEGKVRWAHIGVDASDRPEPVEIEDVLRRLHMPK